jgi:hypothetical protein
MLEHQAEFVNALRGGREMREPLFDTMERCYAPSSVDGRDRKDAPKMSLLCKQIQKERASDFVTQYY